ncbi:hypothetical protein B1H18_03090 [Streptomyces tsukubensis]|uniref:Barstar (barnase inhibitor) domain-containing protein n=1 Tax=Streptomyces tsukubensis TaxID=83656 RepID=A0A1V4ADI1_9ACTN|nr:hypothetical protein B1H18_03090 [Streptomyces tsukubensis]
MGAEAEPLEAEAAEVEPVAVEPAAFEPAVAASAGGGQSAVEPAAAVLDVARAGGWETVSLDLSGVEDKAAFMDRCARDLALPDWFGRNWDALADCLADLSWAPPARGRLFVVSHWAAYARTAPRDWRIAQEVLRDTVTHWRASPTPVGVLLDLDPDTAPEDPDPDSQPAPGPGPGPGPGLG